MFSTGFISLSILLLFPLSITLFVFMHIFDSISFNIDEVLSTNPSAKVFVFVDFNVRHKDCPNYSGETDRTWWTLLSQMSLLRWLVFPLGSLTVILRVLLFWIYFFLLALVIGKFWSCCCLIFHWLSKKLKTGYPVSSHSLTILVLIGTVFMIIWEMFHARISLNSVLLLLLVNFMSGFMYISLIVSIRPNLTHLHGFQQLVLVS